MARTVKKPEKITKSKGKTILAKKTEAKSQESPKNVPEPPAEIKSIPPPPMKSNSNQNNSLVSDERTVQDGADVSRDAKGILLKF